MNYLWKSTRIFSVKKRVSAAAAEQECVEGEEQHDYSGFASLPTDVLISILCRSPASDHKALRDTCKAFRDVLDSNVYKGERIASGWAEVTTRLISGKELYDRENPNGPEDVSLSEGDVDEDATEEERADALRHKKLQQKYRDIMRSYSLLGRCDEDYGWHDITQDIEVDGERCGSIDLVLFPRGADHNYPFHQAANAHSSDLQMVSFTFCDHNGRLRGVPSMERAELIPGEAGKGGFIHIKTVRIHEVYRPLGCTNVLSRAIRSALFEPRLEGKWTLASYISDCNVYMTRKDRVNESKVERDIARDINLGRYTHESEVTAAREGINNRRWECALLDTKSYLRVGFKQILETVGSQKQEPYWLFVMPHLLETPIKSFEEVDETPLVEPPEFPPKPEGIDGEILMIVKRGSNYLRSTLDSIKVRRLELDKLEQNPPVELVELERKLSEARNLIEILEGFRPDHLSEERWEELLAEIQEVEEMGRAQRTAMEESIERHRDGLKNETDATISRAVEILEKEVRPLVQRGGSVTKSYAIHCISRLRTPAFIDFLLEMIPPEERDEAVSGLDDNGLSPLHTVFLGTPAIYERDEYFDIVERLLGLGADTNVKSKASGVTPVGQYRSVMYGKFDTARIYGYLDAPAHGTLEEWRVFHRKMEALLKPTRGETVDDIAAKCSLLDNDADPNIEMDDNEDLMDVEEDAEVGDNEGDDISNNDDR